MSKPSAKAQSITSSSRTQTFIQSAVLVYLTHALPLLEMDKLSSDLVRYTYAVRP